jgi:hypothetical protein
MTNELKKAKALFDKMLKENDECTTTEMMVEYAKQEKLVLAISVISKIDERIEYAKGRMADSSQLYWLSNWLNAEISSIIGIRPKEEGKSRTIIKTVYGNNFSETTQPKEEVIDWYQKPFEELIGLRFRDVAYPDCITTISHNHTIETDKEGDVYLSFGGDVVGWIKQRGVVAQILVPIKSANEILEKGLKELDEMTDEEFKERILKSQKKLDKIKIKSFEDSYAELFGNRESENYKKTMAEIPLEIQVKCLKDDNNIMINELALKEREVQEAKLSGYDRGWNKAVSIFDNLVTKQLMEILLDNSLNENEKVEKTITFISDVKIKYPSLTPQ